MTWNEFLTTRPYVQRALARLTNPHPSACPCRTCRDYYAAYRLATRQWHGWLQHHPEWSK